MILPLPNIQKLSVTEDKMRISETCIIYLSNRFNKTNKKTNSEMSDLAKLIVINFNVSDKLF